MKKKILIIADSPLVPSGVGTQTKYMIESLLKTGKYQFFCLAGAIKHGDYRMHKIDPWGDDWIIKPVDGYGTADVVRAVLRDYKPDLLWFMTDPRFYVWLWQIENEVRKKVPMVYYHVWDNYPSPKYNKKYYDSNDLVCTISKVTDNIVREVSPEVDCIRVPHAVDTEIFKKDEILRKDFRKSILDQSSHPEDKLIFFWNNRNARRKQSGTLIFWFKEYLERVGQDKAILVMHTEPKDPHGQDLNAIIDLLDLKGRVLLSTKKLQPQKLAGLYNAADCTINIADAEGFGLATLESLSCETPIIVNMTGGLQEQVTDGSQWFGLGIEPSSKAIIGSQEVPYIYEDRISKEDFLESMISFTNMSIESRETLGKSGRQHVEKNYDLKQYGETWDRVLTEAMEKYGSWSNRKNYKHWDLMEIK